MEFNSKKEIAGILLLMMTSGVYAREFSDSFRHRADTVSVRSEFMKVSALPEDDERKFLMEFLYSYMSLPDISEYPAEFYLRNMDATLRARQDMPWGKTVPEREFLHFVVPVRINNEDLDLSREVFYDELKDRVKGLSMKDAILEVNHWCHEKVTYKPSDGRTSSPLSSMSQAIGRCGEESTFTVAALRSVGIPARQVYTPRWAHTDDNHAWVEAWADGKWYFLGACEPEPRLNMAWFNAPASRGMLMNTNVFGDYDGPEEVLDKSPLVTKINVTENYAPTALMQVCVKTADGSPVTGADVNFGIYNYAEYFNVATRKTDSEGNASLLTGNGDLVIWASDGHNFGLAKGRPVPGDTLEIVLDRNRDFKGEVDFDINPPASGGRIPAATAEERFLNNRRFAREDSIRSAYTATFATEESAAKDARRLGIDIASLSKILVESRGNHDNIVGLLESMAAEERETAIALLLNVSEKDRRDIDMDVVRDHVANTLPPDPSATPESKEFHARYVLNPRVETEKLTPYKGYLRGLFSEDEAAEFRKDPRRLASWLTGHVRKTTAEENPQNLRMTPRAILTAGKGNDISRKILYVSAARSLGIPSRIDPVTGSAQYALSDMLWRDVDFMTDAIESSEDAVASATGGLALTYTPSSYLEDPKYYIHFTVSKIEDGLPRLMEFDENNTTSKSFSKPYQLPEGQYVLTSGRRLADGGVLARSVFFNIEARKDITLQLEIRNDDSVISVIGSLNAENIYHDLATGEDKSILSTTGRGYYTLGIISPGHEPSAHAINDISAMADQLDATGRKLLLLFEDAESATRFERTHFGKLPENVVWGIDNGGVSLNEIVTSLSLDNAEKPLFVIADTFNRIVFVSQGYTIGLGEKLLQGGSIN